MIDLLGYAFYISFIKSISGVSNKYNIVFAELK